MKTIISVLTSPKRPDYLAQTLVGLDGAGADGYAKFLAVDGLTDTVQAPRSWPLVCVGGGRGGSTYAMLNIFRHAVEMGADELLYFEDDIIPCRRAVTALARMPVRSDCGFLTACDILAVARGLPPGVQRIRAADDLRPHRAFWGTMALKIPSRALRYLAEFEPGANQGNHSDVWLGDHLASGRGRWKYFGTVAPSLFQHVGEKSLCSPEQGLEPWRVAQDFSADFDAGELQPDAGVVF